MLNDTPCHKSADAVPAAWLHAFADDYPQGSQFWDQDADWYQQCMRAKDIQPPAGDLSTLEETEGLSEWGDGIYYGALDNPRAGIAEWKQVRRCAFATNDTGVLRCFTQMASVSVETRTLRSSTHVRRSAHRPR